MDEFLSRAALLLGEPALEKLKNSRVAVLGVGGVGSYAVEALIRGGVGSLLLVDDDVIGISNLNRQLHATMETAGMYKTKVMAKRALSINPRITVETREEFCLFNNISEILGGRLNYIIDAVDTVSAKLAIALYAKENNIPLISCMGAANKLDPTRFEVADIYETSVCPLCRVMRRELKKQGVDSLRVVYSKEEPLTPKNIELPADGAHQKRQTPGSVSFVPPVAGLIAAGEVIKGLIVKQLINNPKNKE